MKLDDFLLCLFLRRGLETVFDAKTVAKIVCI